MTRVSHGIDRLAVSFDDESLVSTLGARLGLEALINSTVRLGARVGGARPGRKVLTLVHAIVADASHINHADILRSGAVEGVLGHRVMDPLHAGNVPSGVHFRPCPPTRGGGRCRPGSGVGSGRGTGSRRVGRRCRLHYLRGGRQGQAGAAFGYTKVLGTHPPGQ